MLAICFEVLGARGVISADVRVVGDIEPSFYNYGFVAVFLFLGIAGMRRMGRFWRGVYGQRIADAFAPLGKTLARALTATVPFVYPCAFVVGVLYLMLILKGQAHSGLGIALEFVANLLTVVFAVLLVVLFSVILFNRPHLVVPPHLRDSHGLIGDAARAALRRLRR